MTATEDALKERIRRDGPISLEAYMSIVTEAYYARGDVFGRDGDFITAPEISQTFGELIGLWCAVVWQNMGAPASFRLVECGPGRGTLMKDILRAAARAPGFATAADIHLVERSEALRAKQRETLATYSVTWHDDIARVPAGPLILVANEFLDALPIRQFEMSASGWKERFVSLNEHGALMLQLHAGAPTSAPAAQTGDLFETSPSVTAFIADLARRLAVTGGAALLIDYGYKATALGDTLQAVAKHKPCDIFDAPGEADLTAHVNFSAVADTATAAGTRAFGPVEQGAWLNRLGIQARGLQLAKGKAADVAETVSAGIRRLTQPDAMGVLFKVMALAHPSLATPEGFQQDGAA